MVLNSDTLVYCRYSPVVARGAMLVEHFGGRSAKAIEQEIGSAEHTAAVVELLAKAAPAALLAGRDTGDARVIRASATTDAPVIGLLAEGEEPAVLEGESGFGAWSKVAHEGLVGYVEHRPTRVR